MPPATPPAAMATSAARKIETVAISAWRSAARPRAARATPNPTTAPMTPPRISSGARDTRGLSGLACLPMA